MFPLYIQTRRTIFSGANPIYQATANQTGGNVAVREGEGKEDWVWLHAANKPPRDAPALTVLTVRDTGCSDDVRDNNKSRPDGKEAVLGEPRALEMQQLGDVYHRAGRWAFGSMPERYQSRASFVPDGDGLTLPLILQRGAGRVSYSRKEPV